MFPGWSSKLRYTRSVFVFHIHDPPNKSKNISKESVWIIRTTELKISKISLNIHSPEKIVGGFNPSETYKSIGFDWNYSQDMKSKKCSKPPTSSWFSPISTHLASRRSTSLWESPATRKVDDVSRCPFRGDHVEIMWSTWHAKKTVPQSKLSS